jgi:tryptophan synthase alpha chain
MNRIVERFTRLKTEGKKGLIVYIGAGDPDLNATLKLAVALASAGVDVLELGVPFSDPLADGLVNQLAAQRGLESGTTPGKLLEMVSELRRQSSMPVVLYIYYNLIHRQGCPQFIRQAAQAGVDGLLVLDLPPEEAESYETLMNQAGMCPIFLLAPTTPEPRMELIANHARGFLYYVSREGVTGMQKTVAQNLDAMIARIRRHTDLPLAVGFGISTPDQARQVAQYADAVVVGSAIVSLIAQYGKSDQLIDQVTAFVRRLSEAIKS